MLIKIDDLTGVEIKELLNEHLIEMSQNSPPESTHALNIIELQKPGITFWSGWEEGNLVGCGALKELDSLNAEIKSMRTASLHLKKGVARKILRHIMNQAKEGNYRRLSLETGSMAAFEPARKLYENFGFVYCEPFADYVDDPNSVFMTREL
ncbi:MAG: GNAT family N-acetyltransferase [Proteobacteria bacterium]|jgi:putative acetyltransferase|nr:GNAT family N-acetyltransferase [Pseudomonadota bacterium]MBT5793566.1 GNAT family N-acetyltransferase [Deltaproteobacteria bacterium]MDB3917243.1 GNAT family N-acetyltransferase [bacterium]